jgi:toxin CptA
MAAVALGCAWLSLSGIPLLLVATGIALAFILQVTGAGLQARRKVRCLELGTEGAARWQDGAGQWHQAEVLPDTFVSQWLIVLNLAEGGRRSFSLVLLCDSAPADELRQLRVWLRWRLKTA